MATSFGFQHNAEPISAYIRIISSLFPSLPAASAARYSCLLRFMPGCTVATSLWFQEHRVVMGHSWPQLSLGSLWNVIPPWHHHHINPLSLTITQHLGPQVSVCVCVYTLHTESKRGNNSSLHYWEGEVKDRTAWCGPHGCPEQLWLTRGQAW